jgi:nucleoside-diphosphate-sugar epimerase
MNKLMGKRILITGGAGYLATSLVHLLKNSDCRIIRLDRPGASFLSVAGLARIENIFADIRDPESWDRILAAVDIVFHFAAQTSVYVANEDPNADLSINVLPMLNLLETCRRKNFRPMVLFSGTATEAGLPVSLPVDETHPDNPITVYDLHKWMAENYLKHYVREGHVRGAILRLANVYGPGPRSSSADRGVLNMMVRRALSGEALTIYGDGNFIRDYIYVEDVASAFIMAASNIDQVNGAHFIIGSGDGHTIAEALHLVAASVERKTGRCVQVLHVDPPATLSPIEKRNFVAATDRFTAATNWRSKVTLQEGIDRVIDDFVAQTPLQ